MKKLIFILSLLTLASCKKEEKETPCQCYEVHERNYQPAGQPEVWVNNYNTSLVTDDCSSAHDWIVDPQGYDSSYRMKKVCK